MDWHSSGPFAIAALLVVVMPGPVMAIIAHNTLRHGTMAGLLTVLGVELGELCLLAATFLAVATSAALFPVVVRWLGLAGALYLAWLAASALRARGAPAGNASATRAGRPVVEGLTVAFANPAAIVFYAAFFSQFLRPDYPIARQAAALSAIYLTIAFAFDAILVFALARIRMPATSTRFGLMLNLGSAGLYLAIAVVGAFGFISSGFE
jgi:threonine/homoserine/homoserine lactone efflux protein